MTQKPLYTADVARAVGVHPNTVRLYEAWGYLPPIPRSHAGYRLFSNYHVDQMRLARLALHGPYPGGKAPVEALVKTAAAGHLGTALEHAYQYLSQVRAEYVQAEAAALLLERWAGGTPIDATAGSLRIGQVARLLDISQDKLRHWERNRLLTVPRDPVSGYRLYGAAEIGRLRVIRLLRASGYSMTAVLRLMTHLDQGRVDNLRAVLDTPTPDDDAYSAADTWLFDGLIQMARYPVQLYPGWLRLILTWIIPVGLMTTLPAQVLAGPRSASPALLLVVCLFALVLFLISSHLFHTGLRRYASASS